MRRCFAVLRLSLNHSIHKYALQPAPAPLLYAFTCCEVIYLLLHSHFISSVQRSKRCYVKTVSFIAHKPHFSVSMAAFVGSALTITNKTLDLVHTRLPYCQAVEPSRVQAACFHRIMIPSL